MMKELVDGGRYRVSLFPPFRTVGTFTCILHLSGIDVILEFKNGQRLKVPGGIWGHPAVAFEELDV